jgi:hypothetical protein
MVIEDGSGWNGGWNGVWSLGGRAETLAERGPWHWTGSLIGRIRPPRLLAKSLDDVCATHPIIIILLPPNIARFGSSGKMTRASQTISLLVVLLAVWHSLFTSNAS